MKLILTALKQLKRILIHKFWVAYYCFQIGLYRQGIFHDMSKFSWTEFSISVKYWDDKISALANERNINGYSKGFLHHRGRNPHHYEYWVHHIDEGGIAAPMPRKYMLELICDYLAACRTYGGDIKTEYDWFKKQNIKMNKKTYDYCLLCFSYIKYGYSLREAIKSANCFGYDY